VCVCVCVCVRVCVCVAVLEATQQLHAERTREALVCV
jgi:hypothetical protein